MLGLEQVWGEGLVLNGEVHTQRGDWFSNLLVWPEELSFLCFKSYNLEGSRTLKSFWYIGHYEEIMWKISLKALSDTYIESSHCISSCLTSSNT